MSDNMREALGFDSHRASRGGHGCEDTHPQSAGSFTSRVRYIGRCSRGELHIIDATYFALCGIQAEIDFGREPKLFGSGNERWCRECGLKIGLK